MFFFKICEWIINTSPLFPSKRVRVKRNFLIMLFTDSGSYVASYTLRSSSSKFTTLKALCHKIILLRVCSSRSFYTPKCWHFAHFNFCTESLSVMTVNNKKSQKYNKSNVSHVNLLLLRRCAVKNTLIDKNLANI